MKKTYNRFRRIMLLMLAAALTLSLCACGSTAKADAVSSKVPAPTAEAEPTPDPTPEPTPEPVDPKLIDKKLDGTVTKVSSKYFKLKTSKGKTYKEAVADRWKLDIPMPENLANIVIKDVSDIQDVIKDVDFVFIFFGRSILRHFVRH